MPRLFRLYLKFAQRSWTRETMLRVSTIFVLMFTYTISVFLCTSAWNLSSVSQKWIGSGKMQVYLSDEDQERYLDITRKVKSIEGVESISYISAEQVKLDFIASTGMKESELYGSQEGSEIFSPTLEVQLHQGISDDNYINKTEKLSKKIRSIAGVEDVVYGKNWLDKYISFIRFTDLLILSIISLLIFSSLVILSNLIRVLIHSHKDDIEILELVGETYLNIRAPYIIEGIVFSVSAFLLSMIFNQIIFYSLNINLSQSAAMINLKELILAPSISFGLGGFILSGFIGGVTSYIITKKINTGWSFSQRRS